MRTIQDAKQELLTIIATLPGDHSSLIARVNAAQWDYEVWSAQIDLARLK